MVSQFSEIGFVETTHALSLQLNPLNQGILQFSICRISCKRVCTAK